MENKTKKLALEFQIEALQEGVIENRKKIKECEDKGDLIAADILQMEINFMEADLQELQNEYFFLV